MEHKKSLGSTLCNNILFLHAISGCDTTSCPFGIGKSAPLKKFCDSSYYREQARKFDAVDACADDVVKAGENALVAMYGGWQGESLDSLRHPVNITRKYVQKAIKSSFRICHQHQERLESTA